jgi:hypothetical protein
MVEQPKILRMECDSAGKLKAFLVDQDEPVEDVRVARCFPWSLPEDYISVRDPQGREIVLLTSLDELDDTSRDIVREELAHKVFNPRIQCVKHCATEFGITSMTVETDRGEVTFQLGSRDDVRHLSATRVLLNDVDGNIYEVPDVSRLDGDSQRRLAMFL